MSNRAKFWDKHAAGYAKSKISNEDAYQRKLKETQALLSPDMTMLEIGCGTGTTSLHHAPFVASILATDISANMLQIGRDKAKAANIDNVEFRQGDMDSLALEENRFDVVMAHSVLHLVDDSSADIQKLARVLKPGGIFISSTACLKGPWSWTKPIVAIGSALGVLPKVAFFNPDELMTQMKAAGFTIDDHWQPSKKEALFVVAHKSL